MKKVVGLVLTLLCAATIISAADSDFAKEFKSNYNIIDEDLLSSANQQAAVKNFVYKKDVATFTFEDGMMYLLRPILGRPTTAVFIGHGHADIRVPSHIERMSMLSIVGDTTISEDFQICFIRMADDFDKKLQEEFPTESTQLKWKNFTIVKQEHSEEYFKPVVENEYDNYFELLRSLYERADDGYFWAHFNRTVFTYDPNQPEEVNINYEFQEGEFVPTLAARFEKMSDKLTEDTLMSHISYPTTFIEKHGDIEMGGLDGTHIENAKSEVKLVVNRDSLRFVSTFLHFNLKVDSIYYDGRPVDYNRRKDFRFIGIMLPAYRHRGDTLDLTFWYDGYNFNSFMPYVADPQVCRQTFTFAVPKGYNYIMPGMGPIQPADHGEVKFDVDPGAPYNKFYFQGYATDYDTTAAVSDIGMAINFIRSRHLDKRIECFVPDNMYQGTTMDAFNFMSSHFGAPVGTFGLNVFGGSAFSMPGLVEIPQVICYNEGTLSGLGGFSPIVGYAMAHQWFGSRVRPLSYRDNWLKVAVDAYLSLMFVQNSVSGDIYYSNLVVRRDSLRSLTDVNRDRPLAVSERSMENIQGSKGAWLFHMLRYLMFDLNTHDDSKFTKFIYELALTCNNKTYSDADVIRLAEKHYGQPLGWFFKEWLYDYGYPEYNVDYSIKQEGAEYYIDAAVQTTGVRPYFHMPVIMRVALEDGESKFMRQDIPAGASTFRLGPFSKKPNELIFNELYSVLSKDNVNKK